MKMTKSSKKRKRKDNNSCLDDGCMHSIGTGCVPIDLDGCNLDADGCIPDFDGCTFTSSLMFLPVRWIVIIGLMVYGDWDYQNHTAKTDCLSR